MSLLSPKNQFQTTVLNIQDNEDDLPFKVIVDLKQQFERPVCLKDGKIFSLQSKSNLEKTQCQISNYKQQIEQIKINKNQKELLNQTRKQIMTQFLNYNDTQVLRNDYNTCQSNDDLQKYCIEIPVVCSIYNNEPYAKLKQDIDHILNMQCVLIVLINGFSNLEIETKQYLQSLIKDVNYDYLCYSNIIVLHHTNQKVLYFIKYQEVDYPALLNLIYMNILPHFDQKHSIVTQFKYDIHQNFRDILSFMDSQNYCGLSPQVDYHFSQERSKNPFHYQMALENDRLIFHLEKQTQFAHFYTFRLIHDPLNCFYNWSQLKHLIPEYLNIIRLGQQNHLISCIQQDLNNILPIRALQHNLFFGFSPNISCETTINSNIIELINQNRRQFNSYSYSQDYFWKNAKFINRFFVNFQLLLMHIQTINIKIYEEFGLAALFYIIFYCSYSLSFQILDFDYQISSLIAIVFPYLALLISIILFIFTITTTQIVYKNSIFYIIESILNFIILVIIIGSFILDISQEYNLIWNYMSILGLIIIAIQKLITPILLFRGNFLKSYMIGLASLLTHFGLTCQRIKFYNMQNLNKTYEGVTNKDITSYHKITNMAEWLVLNMAVCFIFYLIEKIFEYEGYIFTILILYYSLQSFLILFSAIFQAIAKLHSVKKTEHEFKEPEQHLGNQFQITAEQEKIIYESILRNHDLNYQTDMNDIREQIMNMVSQKIQHQTQLLNATQNLLPEIQERVEDEELIQSKVLG